MIIDEAHDGKSALRNASRIMCDPRRRWLVTGTPFTASTSQLKEQAIYLVRNATLI